MNFKMTALSALLFGSIASPAMAQDSAGACPPGMTMSVRSMTGTRYCVGVPKWKKPSSGVVISGGDSDAVSAGNAKNPESNRAAASTENKPVRAWQEFVPPSGQIAGSTAGFIESQPKSCQPGFELRPPHMLATTMECLPMRCRDNEVLEAGQCFINGSSPSQRAALVQRMSAPAPGELYCPADSTMVLHSAGYTWLCKPKNAYAFSGESQWPVAKNRVLEQIQSASAGLGVGRGCSAQIDWRDAQNPSRGFCRIELGVGFPLDSSGSIKNGYSGLVTRYNEGSAGSVTATCVNGIWQLANAVCNSTSNTYGHNDGTGKVVMDVGFGDAQTRLNAEIEAQRKANEAAVYAAEAARNLAAQNASRAPLIAEQLAVARDATKDINARIGAYNQAHIWLGDGKQVGGMGPRCNAAIVAAQKSEGAIMASQQAIINDPNASAGAKGAAADRILSLHMSATGAGGNLRGPIKQLCDDEFNQMLAN